MLETAITRQGTLFLWPLRLPGPDGRLDAWGQSALEAAQVARERWGRVTANMGSGGYDVFVAPERLAPPEWPATPFSELFKVAFKDRLIDDLNHPVLQRLRGEL